MALLPAAIPTLTALDGRGNLLWEHHFEPNETAVWQNSVPLAADLTGDGEAEIKLGPALKPFRKNSFLACKTQMRDAAGARKELETSLKRLHTDHFDLYQFHAPDPDVPFAESVG